MKWNSQLPSMLLNRHQFKVVFYTFLIITVIILGFYITSFYLENKLQPSAKLSQYPSVDASVIHLDDVLLSKPFNIPRPKIRKGTALSEKSSHIASTKASTHTSTTTVTPTATTINRPPRVQVVDGGDNLFHVYSALHPYWYEVTCPHQTYHPSKITGIYGWHLCSEVRDEDVEKRSVCVSPRANSCSLVAEEHRSTTLASAATGREGKDQVLVLEVVVEDFVGEGGIRDLLTSPLLDMATHLLLRICEPTLRTGLLMSLFIPLRDEHNFSMITSHMPPPLSEETSILECWYLSIVSTKEPSTVPFHLGRFHYPRQLSRADVRYNPPKPHLQSLLASELGRKVLGLLMPYNYPYTCQNMRRYGSRYDSGYQICMDKGLEVDHNSLVYSFGLGDNWSFDLELSRETGCEVHAFDHTILGTDNLPSTVTYHHLGLSAQDTILTKTLDTIMKLLGHEGKTLDVLKMDIEGSEKLVLEQVMGSKSQVLRQVKQLAIEYHNPEPYDQTVTIFEGLAKYNFSLYLVHLNPWDIFGVYEMYFVNTNFLH